MYNRKSLKLGRYTLLLICTVSALLTLTLVIAVMACIALACENPMGLVKPFAIIALIVSASLSGFVGTKITNNVWVSCLSSLAVSLTILAGGIIASGGLPNLSVPLNALIYMAASSLFTYFATKKKQKRHRR